MQDTKITPGNQALEDDIRRTLALYHPDGTTFELCGIGTDRYPKAVDGGFFNDYEKAVVAAGKLTRDHHAVYLTINPVDPALLSRANNRIKPSLARTQDREVLRLQRLFIDADPVRPSGTNSTNQEHETAIELCGGIKADLGALGWPEPLVADSGNGGHLIYCLPDFPNAKEEIDLIKSCLQALARRYNTNTHHIDETTFNPSRLSKLYGTWARKGDSTPDRPHRLARILSVSDHPQSVPLELLEALATTAKSQNLKSGSTGTPKTTGTARGKFDLAGYLDKNAVHVKQVKKHHGAAMHVLETCLFDETHTGGEAAIGQAEDGKLFYQCFHDSCKKKTWHDARQKITGTEHLGHFTEGYKPSPRLDGGATAVDEPPRPLQREIPPPEAFPVEALGEVLQGAALALHKSIQAPMAMCAQSVLASADLAVQGHADILIDGREIPISAFFLSVAESGERKSAVDTEATRAHRDFERNLVQEYEAEFRDFSIHDTAYKKLKEATTNKKGKTASELHQSLGDLGPPPTEPLKPFYLLQEPTFEGIYKLLQKGRPSMGLFSDEGGLFLGGHGMKEENRLSMAAGLSALWDGKPLARTRGGDGATKLYGRRFCCHLMVQPVVAGQFLNDNLLRGQGLLSRFLTSWPASTAGTRAYSGLDLTKDLALSQFNQRLFEIIRAKPSTTDERGQELNPRKIGLSHDARELYIAFHNLIERQLGAEQPLEPIKDFTNKVAEHALRLAAILALFDNPHTPNIEVGYVQSGIELAQFYLSEALRLFHTGRTDPDLELAGKLLAWAKGRTGRYVHLREIYQYGPNSIRDAAMAKKISTILQDHGYFIPVVEGREMDGAFRKVVYEVRDV